MVRKFKIIYEVAAAMNDFPEVDPDVLLAIYKDAESRLLAAESRDEVFDMQEEVMKAYEAGERPEAAETQESEPNNIGSAVSGGTTWIILGGAAVAILAAGGFVIVGKKKK